MAQFLAAMIILLVTYPFIINLANGDVFENLLMVALLISAAFTVNRRDAIAGFILVIPAAVCPWLNFFRHDTVPIWVITGTHTVFVGFIIFELLRFVLKATRVNTDVMCAGIAGYLLLGIFWTPMLMVSQMTPGSFTGTHLAQSGALGRFDALYLSFVSLTCLGCNAHHAALEGRAHVVDGRVSHWRAMHLAVMITRLVALYTHSVQEQKDAAKT